MGKLELNQEFIFPIAAGSILFVSDYIFGWLSFITGPIPMLFVLCFIIGLLAVNIEDAIVTTVIALVLGIGICALITPVVLGGVVSSNVDILFLIFYAAVYATRGVVFFFTGISPYGEIIIIYFMVAIMHYFFAPGFSALGVIIRERLRNEIAEGDEESKTVIPEVMNLGKIVRNTDSTN